jgi:antitoxin CptB
MSEGNELQQEGLEIRRKRLQFRAWHRGMREVDLLLGRFADAMIDDLDEAELAEFEALMGLPDPDVLGWVMGGVAVPPEADSAILRKILAFHGTDLPSRPVTE